MTVSEIFGVDCRGTVFDLPCPDSYVAGELRRLPRLQWGELWVASLPARESVRCHGSPVCVGEAVKSKFISVRASRRFL